METSQANRYSSNKLRRAKWHRNEHTTARASRTDWGAIWAGVFTFVAIWSVFGLLGLAIFASLGNPDVANRLMGMSLGMDIWAIVLTIIARYVAGRETGRLAAVGNRHDGLIHGMIMFGLSVIAGRAARCRWRQHK